MSAQSLYPAPTELSKPGVRWWWMGSAVDSIGISYNLSEYGSKGIGAVEITPIYGVQGNSKNALPFLSPSWMEALRVVEKEGAKNKIQVDMNTGTGWPFGGPEVPIAEAACKVLFTDTIVDSKQLKSFRLTPLNDKEKPFAMLTRVMAYPVNSQPQKGKDQKQDKRAAGSCYDLTSFVTDNVLTWKAPKKGKMLIVCLYTSRTRQKVKRAAPGGEGYVIDHFSRQAVANYLKRFDRAFESTSTPYPTTFFNDSYEVYGANWTSTLLDDFERLRGYKLEEHLPELFGIWEDGNQTLADYRHTLSDLLLNNFSRQWTQWAHSHGALTRNQAHGSPANLIDTYASVDIPEIEGFGLTDFGIRGLRRDSGYVRKNDSDLSMLKYASSAAHITGRQLVSSETFTWLTEHFRTSLSQMKPDLDLMFAAGVNRMFFHGTCYSPPGDEWPGWKFYASVDMSPTNSIWRDADALTQYIRRCQTYLQWGEPDNDFLVYLPVHDIWHQRLAAREEGLLMQFDIHSMQKKAPLFIKTILALNAQGYDCDYISDQFLATTTFDGNQLCTQAGTRYRAIIVPTWEHIPSETRAHLEQLQAQGARVITGVDVSQLSQAATPEVMKSQHGLHAIRRANALGHHYFVSNLTPTDIDAMVPLAVNFRSAMLYDPLTGRRTNAISEGNKLRLHLRSGESVIIQTFKTIEDAGSDDKVLVRRTAYPLRHGWKLTFTDSHPAVEETFSIDTLTTWERLSHPSAQETMGTGSYATTFRLDKKDLQDGGQWMLDLGDVRESARVWLNGKYVGCAWCAPFTLVCGDALQEGENTLRIDVTNLPANRIAALDRRGVPWRKFEEINVVDINYKKTTYAHWSPVPSGLNGDVTLWKCEELGGR